MSASDVPANLKEVVRKEQRKDMQRREENEKLEKEAWKYCLEKNSEKRAFQKLIDVDCLFEKSKIIFYFTAGSRVDFREIGQRPRPRFKIRIELKQIGARQENTHYKRYWHLRPDGLLCGDIAKPGESYRQMAKEQSMSLNPEKFPDCAAG